MDFMNRMQESKQNFTKNDWKLYESIISSPDDVAYKSASDFAASCGVSQPAVTRFIHSLGYDRYQDFRSDLVSYLALVSKNDSSSIHKQEYFSLLNTTIREAENLLTEEYMTDLAKYVLSFRHIYACGHVKSHNSAKLFSILSRKLGIYSPAVDLHDVRDIAEIMNEDELIIFYSVNGHQELFDQITNGRGSLMIVTAAHKQKKLRENDRLVSIPYPTKSPEKSSISPIMFSIFTELLVSYMMRADSFNIRYKV